MTVAGVGVDVVDIARFGTTLQRTPSLRARLFTAAEADLPLESLAGRFAAKEAFAKALRAPKGLAWHEVEVITQDDGAPTLNITGQARAAADALGIVATHVSISHDGNVATALVVAEC
jgi:holo-[acyl-carrier protein] synthase